MSSRVTFKDVLRAELEELGKRRGEALSAAAGRPAPAAKATEKELIQEAHRFRALGLALSGGGIRSATFNLGIVQGLAKHGLLPHIDYLSTVSGGGYVGSWLHGLIKRKHNGSPKAAAAFLDPEENRVPATPDRDAITFLRKYSNYLAPRPGIFSVDSWVIGSIWIRNMLLNLAILVPFLAAAMLAALYVFKCVQPRDGVILTWGVVAFVGLVVAVANGAKNLSDIAKGEVGAWAKRWGAVLSVGGVLAAALGLYAMNWTPAPLILKPGWPGPKSILFGCLAALFGVFQGFGGFFSCFRALHPHVGSKRLMPFIATVLMSVTAAGVGSLLLIGVLRALSDQPGWQTVIWGPPAIVVALLAATSLHIGLMGADYYDACREWLARVGSILGIFAVVWLGGAAITIYGPLWVTEAVLASKSAVAAIGAWLLTAGAGSWMAKRPETSGAPNQGSNQALEFLVKLAPPLAVIALLVAISAGVHVGLSAMISCAPSGLADFRDNYEANLNDGVAAAWPILAVCVLIVLVLPTRVNINEFSMHHFYKNRLVRCYLGASNDNRRPNPFTGFDSSDDIPIRTLLPSVVGPETRYFGPYPIVNTALNTTTGDELATQARKATSFVFTPKYCGFSPRLKQEAEAEGSYWSTADYFHSGGPDIGTAMAISGAAANPNWGYHSDTAVAFLLTLLNVRLGWWVGNPRRESKKRSLSPPERPGPVYALNWLLWELLGQTKDTSKYLNLSDGGHFENLGVYELIRRRCRYIIVGDGEQDNDYSFESLGGVIRKCRTDFGVEIDIDVEQIRSAAAAGRAHCVVGTIYYPDEDPTPKQPIAEGGEPTVGKLACGWILYFKASLTGDESEDIKQYHKTHPDFPHQSTMNQFFTESQFESYRRLGLHVVDSAFGMDTAASIATGAGLPNADDGRVLDKVFQRLAAIWYAPTNVGEGVATRHAEAYSGLVERLSQRKELLFLEPAVVLHANTSPWADPPDLSPEARKAAVLFVLQLIQLMENLWFDFGLHVSRNRDNPRNGGWMSVFRHWMKNPFIANVWKDARGNFNPLFGEFADSLFRIDAKIDERGGR